MELEDIKNPIELCLYFEKESESGSAYKVNDGDISTWIPKSQIYVEDSIRINEYINVALPEWLCIEKGFI